MEWRAAVEPESIEKCTTTSEQNTASASEEAAASTSNMSTRPEKTGYDELPKEMHEMKIRDDKSDSHEENLKVNINTLSVRSLNHETVIFFCSLCKHWFAWCRIWSHQLLVEMEQKQAK